jgi:dTDP-4-amino-4,6-dideoxygalactose transaminase
MENKIENQQKFYVTRPSIPDLDNFLPMLKDIWKSKWLTNEGKYHQRFEEELAKFLGVKNISLVSNGTLALIIALRAHRITGEVITTPYSFVATAHAIQWNGNKPVFVDIEPKYLNIDPQKIEAAITPKTSAILPVHIYGNPCYLNEIQRIADIYGLKVIYDACHAFGVEKNNVSILNYGDLSVLSFHATKVFTTIEGGAIICQDEKTKKRIDFLRNFGFADEVTVIDTGINAKMNEIQAVIGISQLKEIEKYIEKRKEITYAYRLGLRNIKGIKYLNNIEGVKHNYAYFPIFVDEKVYGRKRDELFEELKMHNIYGRRYFYPLISHFPAYRGLESSNPSNLPVAEKFTNEVICLPLFPDLPNATVSKIINIIELFGSK